jgi:hypothetical protein
MEQHLQRPLAKGEVVHHKDGNKSNNAIKNLELYSSHADHMRIHKKGFCSDTHRECTSCHTIKMYADFYKRPSSVCKACVLIQRRAYHAKRNPPKKKIYHCGSSHANAKLTESDILEIRRLYAAGNVRLADLSEKFNVHLGHISLIVRRKAWAHI